MRRIDKLKKLYKEIGKKTENDLNKKNKKRTCYNIIYFIAFSIAILTDFILPIAINMDIDFTDNDEKYEKEKSILELGVLLAIVFSVLWSSYTIITIYSTKRRRYITADFLYDRQINDNINLMKTVQIICNNFLQSLFLASYR